MAEIARTRSELSKAAFGNSYFADIVLAIANCSQDQEHITVREIARTSDTADALVSPVFRRLTELGALVPVVRGPIKHAYRVDRENLEIVLSTAKEISIRAEAEEVELESQLWARAEQSLEASVFNALKRLYTLQRSRRLEWLATAIDRMTEQLDPTSDDPQRLF
jgi:hypothetical protein